MCWWPHLKPIRRENARDFLFVGDPTEIYYDIQVSEYQSRINTSLLNGLPPKLEKLLYYFVILSSALAALNAVPCWRLDGCLTLAALINHLQIIGPRTKPKLVRGLTHLGTALLVANMALGVLDLILWYYRSSKRKFKLPNIDTPCFKIWLKFFISNFCQILWSDKRCRASDVIPGETVNWTWQKRTTGEAIFLLVTAGKWIACAILFWAEMNWMKVMNIWKLMSSKIVEKLFLSS